MKTVKRIILILAISIVSSQMVRAQWEPTSGPVGGLANAVYRIGNRILVGSNGNTLHASQNLGQNWQQSKSSYYSPLKIEMMLGKLYSVEGASSGELNFSLDSGKTWATSNIKNGSSYLNAYTRCLYKFGNILFWGGEPYYTYSENVVQYSLDSGKTWQSRVGLGSTLRLNYPSKVNGYASIGTRLFAATTQGVFYTADTGNTWFARNSGISTLDISGIWAVGTSLYAINTNGNVYRSIDSALTWTLSQNGISTSGTRSVRTIYEYKGNILGSALGNDTLYVFNETLTKWMPYSYDIKGNYGQNFYGYGDTLYMGSKQGLYYSTNSGVNWTLVSGKIRGLSLYGNTLAIGSSILVVDDAAKVYRSADNGDTWNTLSTGATTTSGLYSFTKTENGFAYLSTYESGYKIRLSTDTGTTWTALPNAAASAMTYINAACFTGSKYLLLGNSALYSSVDSGKTVTNISTAISTNLGNLNQLKQINGVVWLVTSRYGLVKSTDGGTTWNTSNVGLPTKYNGTLGTYDTAANWINSIGTVLLCSVSDASTSKIYISTNNGQTWTLRSNSYFPGDASVYNSLMFSGNYFSQDTLLTYNYGGTISAPYSNQISTSVISGSYVFAVNGSQGVWRKPLSSLTKPNAPTGGIATGVDQSRILVRWNKNANTSSYTLYYKYIPTGAFYSLTTISNDTSYMHTYGSPAATIEYYIVATNEFGNSANSATFSGTTMAKPASATNATGTGISTTQIRLTWKTNNTTATKYYIEQSTNSCCPFNLIDSVNAADTFYVVNNLNRKTTYWYRIRCKDAGGYSDYTTAFSGTTNDTLPKAPAYLDATPNTQTAISLVWADSSDNETGFVIERKDSLTGNFVAIDSVGVNVYYYTSNQLIGGKRYYYRVRAKNTGGYSAYSNIDSADTYPAPNAPSGLSISSITSSKVVLNWTDNSTNEMGFVVERATSSTGPFTTYSSTSANTTTFNATGLSSQTRYYFRVKAQDAYGFSVVSNMVDTTTLPTPPADPYSLTTTTLSNSSIRLSWWDNSSNETYFDIEQSLSPSSGFVLIDSVLANVTTYTVANLNPGTYYYYRVKARNMGGASGYTNYAMGITNSAAPLAPSSLSLVASMHDWVKLSWSDNSSNETEFVLERAVGSGSFFEMKRYASGTTIGYDSTVIAGNNYKYRVYAVNTGGNSSYSNELAVYIATPPQSLSATSNTYYSAIITWTDASVGVTRYIIERKEGSGTYAAVDSIASSTMSYTDVALQPSTAYTYRVKSYVNNMGYSNYSNEASAATTAIPAGIPVAPSALTVAAVTTNSATIQWQDNSTDEVKFYIERAGASGFEIVDSVAANVTQYINTGLAEGTTYMFRVRAGNDNGYSTYSNTATTTTTFDLVAPKALYTELLSTYKIKLSWTDLSANETGFVIERSNVANENFVRLDSVGANVTTYTDFVTAKGVFYYRVMAKKNSTYSDVSNVAVGVNIAAGIDDVELASKHVYPNPAIDYLYINATDAIKQITIVDYLGNTQQVNWVNNNGENRVDVMHLTPGVYFVVWTLQNGETRNQRIIKQ
jgi:hypothetical protein